MSRKKRKKQSKSWLMELTIGLIKDNNNNLLAVLTLFVIMNSPWKKNNKYNPGVIDCRTHNQVLGNARAVSN